MTKTNASPKALLRQLLGWYDRDQASDDELELIIAHARQLVEQSDAADQPDSEYVLYDFDSDLLLSTKVYARYADAAADARRADPQAAGAVQGIVCGKEAQQ